MTTGGLRTRRREDLCRRREELKPRIIELRAAGRTWDNIAAELGASRSVLCRIVGPDEDPAHKPKSPRPKPLAPEELAAQAVSLHEQGLSAWSISRTLGMLFRDVHRAIAAAKLREQVESGRLRIRQATAEEMGLFRQQRAAHDRAALEERDRVLRAA